MFAAVLVARHAEATCSTICVQGQFSVQWETDFAVIRADSIVNHRIGGHSGTLYAEIWALEFPYAGGALFGHRMARAEVGVINGGRGIAYESGPVPWTLPPPGRYFMYLVLVEFGGGIESYSVFNNPLVVEEPTTTTTTTTRAPVPSTSTTLPTTPPPPAPIAPQACPFACTAEVEECRAACPSRPRQKSLNCRKRCRKRIVKLCRITATCS